MNINSENIDRELTNEVNDSLTEKKSELFFNLSYQEYEKVQKYIDLIKKANLLFKERKYEEARNIYKEASDLFPKYPYPKNQIVKIFDRLQRKKTRSKNKSNKRNIISKSLKKDFKGEFEDVLSAEFLDNNDD
ncbi:hypothetical protein K9M48_05440 [Candidatus Gracilibacteria bacterium]|nr:hypothetical protein [Candidatus Gracilibacteria bacterium]